jgi:hypothetical protein
MTVAAICTFFAAGVVAGVIRRSAGVLLDLFRPEQ